MGFFFHYGILNSNFTVPMLLLGVIGFLAGLALPAVSLIVTRPLRKNATWHTPDLLAGFGPPSFVFTDKFRYVSNYLMLRGRLAFGHAFGINSVSIFGASLNTLVHFFKSIATRRAV